MCVYVRVSCWTDLEPSKDEDFGIRRAVAKRKHGRNLVQQPLSRERILLQNGWTKLSWQQNLIECGIRLERRLHT